MEYKLSLQNVAAKNIYSLGEDFRGRSKDGTELSVTNYYMEKNGSPFFGISGEFHFSRMSETRWEDEIIKMKMGGLNVIATYVFWIHHEEEEGKFDFTGRRNLGEFIRLCKKHGMYVILRVGPFDHGEVRNGGLPDWLYGKPFEVRKLSEGFLSCVRKLYSEVASQVKGMFFQDGGPIIGVQIDNEYMHSSAPWEMTTGISDEWVFGGDEGNTYMLRLKSLAAECGLTPVFYTCTGWGGAATPESMLPLWGGYAFRPWIFYSHKGEHPATEEYLYQDFHNNQAECNYDFHPAYAPEEKPYSCCEMGGGMTCSYYYRFRLPYKSVDAMANIKLASGCNFLGYYMYQGGSNPLGMNGLGLNEGQVPKISYDYQAALGEFGQVRESYHRTRSIHYFAAAFSESFCGLKTVLPQGASWLDPKDVDTLRYAVRTDGKRGFLFVNNYQDHVETKNRAEESVTLQMKDEDITFRFGIAAEENAILPFHMDLDGIDLVQATAQPVTRLERDGEATFVFFVPEGMQGSFTFEPGAQAVRGSIAAKPGARAEGVEGNFAVEPEPQIAGGNGNCHVCPEGLTAETFTVTKGERAIHILTVSRALASQLYIVSGGRLIFTDQALLEEENRIRLETVRAENQVLCYPPDALEGSRGTREERGLAGDVLGSYLFTAEKPYAAEGTESLTLRQVGLGRYTLEFPESLMEGVKDVRLQLDYSGDIGHAFLNSRMINDNFANGAAWEIGLKDFAEELADNPMVIYITPLREGANVNVESAMAGRKEEAQNQKAQLIRAALCPVYEIRMA